MIWDWSSATSYNASGQNPLSPENYLPTFRWGNGATGGDSTNAYFGSGFSVNRYVSMADYSTGGILASGRYDGAPTVAQVTAKTSDFNYRFNMSNENGWDYGRDT